MVVLYVVEKAVTTTFNLLYIPLGGADQVRATLMWKLRASRRDKFSPHGGLGVFLSGLESAEASFDGIGVASEAAFNDLLLDLKHPLG